MTPHSGSAKQKAVRVGCGQKPAKTCELKAMPVNLGTPLAYEIDSTCLILNNCTCLPFGAGFGAGLAAGFGMGFFGKSHQNKEQWGAVQAECYEQEDSSQA